MSGMREYINHGKLNLEPVDSAEAFALLPAANHFADPSGQLEARVTSWFEDNSAHHFDDVYYGTVSPDIPLPVFVGAEVRIVVDGLRQANRFFPKDDIRRAQGEMMLKGLRRERTLRYGEVAMTWLTSLPNSLESWRKSRDRHAPVGLVIDGS